jgi:hypothetical protein
LVAVVEPQELLVQVLAEQVELVIYLLVVRVQQVQV